MQLIIKTPSQNIEDYVMHCSSGISVKQLKLLIHDSYPSKPAPEDQKLIYSGHLLQDDAILKDVFQNTEQDAEEIFTLHMVCKPKKSNAMNSARTRTSPSVISNVSTVSNNPSTAQASPVQIGTLESGFMNAEMQQQMLIMQQAYIQYMAQYYAANGNLHRENREIPMIDPFNIPILQDMGINPQVEQANIPLNNLPDANAPLQRPLARRFFFAQPFYLFGNQFLITPEFILDFFYKVIHILLIGTLFFFYTSAFRVVLTVLLFGLFQFLRYRAPYGVLRQQARQEPQAQDTRIDGLQVIRLDLHGPNREELNLNVTLQALSEPINVIRIYGAGANEAAVDSTADALAVSITNLITRAMDDVILDVVANAIENGNLDVESEEVMQALDIAIDEAIANNTESNVDLTFQHINEFVEAIGNNAYFVVPNAAVNAAVDALANPTSTSNMNSPANTVPDFANQADQPMSRLRLFWLVITSLFTSLAPEPRPQININ